MRKKTLWEKIYSALGFWKYDTLICYGKDNITKNEDILLVLLSIW